MLLLLQLTSALLLLSWAGAGRITGGWEARPHSRPYMAFVLIKHSEGAHQCGGFLIRPNIVLSAAHCVSGKRNPKVTVKLGAHNIAMNERSQQVLRVVNWVIHPRYSGRTLQNDIVLLKLKKKARLTRQVGVVSLPRYRENVRIGTKCTVAGWGLTSKPGHSSNVLMEVDLKVQRANVCQRTFGRLFQQKSMICVSDQRRRKATLPGDSGGPLVCNGKVHGIVSYGPLKGILPNVFTRVSYFEPWIRKQLRRFVLQDLPESASSQ